MFENEVQVAKHQLRVLGLLVQDIDDVQYTQPVGGAKNPPAYILCHVAVVNDFLLTRLGQPTLCPSDWAAAFGPTRTPDKVAISYPPKHQVLALIEQGVQAACAAAIGVTPEFAAQPNNIPFLAGTPIQTNGNFITMLLTSHLAMHGGQLSVMRRQLGFSPLF